MNIETAKVLGEVFSAPLDATNENEIAALRTDGGNLLCPFCNGIHTHLDEVSVGFYWENDYDEGTRQAVTRTFSAVDGSFSEFDDTDLKYSSRRHWIELHVDCETCLGGTVVLAQHKGSTEVRFIANPKPVNSRATTKYRHGFRDTPQKP